MLRLTFQPRQKCVMIRGDSFPKSIEIGEPGGEYGSRQSGVESLLRSSKVFSVLNLQWPFENLNKLKVVLIKVFSQVLDLL